jgi:hypothetical protein
MKLLNKIYRRLGRLKYGALYKKNLGTPQVTQEQDFSLVSYYKDGKLDYETYKAVQQAGNIHKINLVSADEASLVEMAKQVGKSRNVSFVLCHGTRNGAEQRYFRSVFPSARILGTEISDTAKDFPDTIQWDFHEVDAVWVGKVDVLYSNSWDHTYDPEKLFKAWGSCISKTGVMVIEHTQGHMPDKRGVLDPFGATVDGVKAMVERVSDLKLDTVLQSGDTAKDRKFLLFTRR